MRYILNIILIDYFIIFRNLTHLFIYNNFYYLYSINLLIFVAFFDSINYLFLKIIFIYQAYLMNYSTLILLYFNLKYFINI
jgi:hypothetical protein